MSSEYRTFLELINQYPAALFLFILQITTELRTSTNCILFYAWFRYTGFLSSDGPK